MTRPITLMDFLEKAKTSLEPATGMLGEGKVVSWIRSPRGREKPIGQIFARLLLKTALPAEIRAAETRYHISLKKLEKATVIDARDILAFCSQLMDARMDLMNSLVRGVVSSKEDFNKIQALKMMKTMAIRERVIRFFSNEKVNHLAIGDKSKKAAILSKDLIRLSLAGVPMTQKAYFEILTKEIASGFIEEGMLIPISSLASEDGALIRPSAGVFEVKKVISSKGLMAFALVPHNADPAYKPTLLFRPTTPDSNHTNALETIADDVSTQIGKRSFELAASSIQRLLNDPTFIASGDRAHVCGFSLGGNHASRTLARFPDKFEKAYFYNDPYTEEQVAIEFTRNLLSSSHSSERPLEIHIDQTDKDIVTHAGEVHVGYIASTYHTNYSEARAKCALVVTRFKSTETERHTHVVPDVGSRELIMSSAVRRNMLMIFQERAVFHTHLTRSAHLRSRSLTHVTTTEAIPDSLHVNFRSEEIQRVNRRRRNMIFLRTVVFCFALIGQFFINCNQFFSGLFQRRVQVL